MGGWRRLDKFEEEKYISAENGKTWISGGTGNKKKTTFQKARNEKFGQDRTKCKEATIITDENIGCGHGKITRLKGGADCGDKRRVKDTNSITKK